MCCGVVAPVVRKLAQVVKRRRDAVPVLQAARQLQALLEGALRPVKLLLVTQRQPQVVEGLGHTELSPSSLHPSRFCSK